MGALRERGSGRRSPGGGAGLSAEQVRDLVAGFLRGGTNVTIVHDDAANTLTISAAGGGGGLTAEQVRDVVAQFVRAGTDLAVTHDDDANTLTIAANLPDASTTDKGIVELATRAEAAARTDTERAVTPDALPLGTTSQEGLLALADNDETDAGTNASKAVTPAGLERRLAPEVSSGEISAGTETGLRRYSPADIVAIVLAHEAEGLTQAQVDDRVRALVAALALQGNADRWPRDKLPSDLVDTDALTAAVANFVDAATIASDRATAIASAIAALAAVTEGGDWSAGTAYAARTIVRHGGATYLSLRAVGANTQAVTEPGTGSDWETYWDRLGYEDGPPNALVGVSRAGHTLTFNRESGQNPIQITLPEGDDPAPAGGFSPTDLGTTTFALDGNAAQVALMNSGSAIVCPEDGYVIAILNVPSLGLAGSLVWMLAADLRDASADNTLVAGLFTNGDNEILLHVGDQDAGASTGNEVIVQHVGTTTDETGSGSSILPSILRFTVTGNARPTAGSIAGDAYGYDLAISQTAEVGAARIVGFAGAPVANPPSVAVLATIPSGSYHSATGSVAIPAGVSLAAGEQYTIRLEVYPTDASVTDAPTIYHDFVVTAQAQAALVHFGLVEYSADDTTVAQRAARIVFADDDLSTSGSAAGDWAISGIPDDGTEYLPYWAVPASLPQPTAWTQSSFPVTNFVEPAVQRTIGGVTYNVYLYTADSRADDSGNGSVITTTV